MNKIKIGVIGGTGLCKFDILQDPTEKTIVTPFGDPSDTLKEGFIGDVPGVFLNRHGKDHRISPSNINYRANIWALKELGCTHILSVTTCGGLQHNTRPGDLVILDQFFDSTRRRENTFYDGAPNSPKGVLHIPMSQPFCEQTRQVLIKSIRRLGRNVHESGTVVTIEGPRFSSRFESKYWNRMGASVINMTTVPEVNLAKELGLCYASLALVTDSDSWCDIEVSVDVQMVTALMKSNVDFVRNVIIEAVKTINEEDWSQVLQSNQDLIQTSLIQ